MNIKDFKKLQVETNLQTLLLIKKSVMVPIYEQDKNGKFVEPTN